MTNLNNYYLGNKVWTFLLWNSLLGSKKQLDKALSLFQDEKVGMVASSLCITKNKKNYNYLLPKINNELIKNGFNPVENFSFVAGTMFLAKTKVLEPCLNYQLNDFETTDGGIKDRAFAHVIERLFSALVWQQGYQIKGLKSQKHILVMLYIMIIKLFRFLYQNKKTSSGKRIIKICKIPVCYK